MNIKTLNIVNFMDVNFPLWQNVDKLALAYLIASIAHLYQVDRGGNAYITHPVQVSINVNSNDSEINQMCLLHDVIEDSYITLSDLINLGFSTRVVSGVYLLTKDSALSYEDNIARLIGNIDVCRVKRGDLKHNLDPTRLKDLTDKTFLKLTSYFKAFKLISNYIAEHNSRT